MLKQITLLCATLAVVLGKPEGYQYTADPRCPPDQRHFLLPHEWDCTRFYYCEYGYMRDVPRSCALGTEFSFALQVCVHPDLANCDLPNAPPQEEVTTEEPTTTKQPTTTEQTPTTEAIPAETTEIPQTTEEVPTTRDPIFITTTRRPRPTLPTLPTRPTWPSFPFPSRPTTTTTTTEKVEEEYTTAEPVPTTTEKVEDEYTTIPQTTEEVPTTRDPIDTTTTRRPRPTLPTLPTRPTWPSFPFPSRPTTTTTTTTEKVEEEYTSIPEITTSEKVEEEYTTAEPVPTTTEKAEEEYTTSKPETTPTRPTPTTEDEYVNEPTTKEPTTPAPYEEIEWLPNGCPADFTIHHLLPHETECHLFYYCVFGEIVLSECSTGLHFNAKLQVCDWPENAGCDVEPRNKCQTECHVNYWAHDDCDKYWKCEGETPVVATCSEGLHFNTESSNCDFICNAGCERKTIQVTKQNGNTRIFVPEGASIRSIFRAVNNA